MNEELKAQERGRPVTQSKSPIPKGHFLVYFFRTGDHVRCSRDGQFLNGSNNAGVIFEQREEAQEYARQFADINPEIGAGVYDSSWKPIAEFVHEDFTRAQERAQAPQRLFLWGGLLLLAGAVLLWLEMRSEWTLIVGFLVGSRLLLAGGLRLIKGVYRLRQRTRI
jgi:hypothetical protein